MADTRHPLANIINRMAFFGHFPAKKSLNKNQLFKLNEKSQLSFLLMTPEN